MKLEEIYYIILPRRILQKQKRQ